MRNTNKYANSAVYEIIEFEIPCNPPKVDQEDGCPKFANFLSLLVCMFEQVVSHAFNYQAFEGQSIIPVMIL